MSLLSARISRRMYGIVTFIYMSLNRQQNVGIDTIDGAYPEPDGHPFINGWP